MKLTVVTSNTKKAKEMIRSLQEFGIETEHVSADLNEPQSLDAKVIVAAKAREAFTLTGTPVIVDDSGFYVEKYNRFPGTLSKYIFKGIGHDGLFSLIQEGDRAHFECNVAYMDGELVEPMIFTGTYPGRVTEDCPRDPNEEMPYAPLFIPDDSSQRLFEMTPEQRSNDHRHQGLRACVEWLRVNRTK